MSLLRVVALVIALDLIAAVGSGLTRQGGTPDIVVRASDIRQASLHGGWTLAGDPTSADGIKVTAWNELFLANPAGDAETDEASALPRATPDDYFDVAFTARARVPYRVWLRLTTSDPSADSVWVQFSDAEVDGTRVYGVDTRSGLLVTSQPCPGCDASGWGWRDTSWSLQQPSTVTFTTNGSHTMRVQAVKGGVQIDQIVLSAGAYMTAAPGSPRDDRTIVERQ